MPRRSLRRLLQNKGTTPIEIDEHGAETHPSWGVLRVNRVSGDATLFESEINHQHYIVITLARASRRRNLSRDWLHAGAEIVEVSLTEAQWVQFVSSFGQGTGTPVTISRLGYEHVPGAPVESRLAETLAEVGEAGEKALSEVTDAYNQVIVAFEEKKGIKEMRKALQHLGNRIDVMPANLEFVAESMTGHMEEVVTRARGDIQRTFEEVIERKGLVGAMEELSQLQIGPAGSE